MIPGNVGPDGLVGVGLREALGTEAALEVVFILFIAVGAGAAGATGWVQRQSIRRGETQRAGDHCINCG